MNIEKFRSYLDSFELALLEIVTRLIPWLAPIPTGYVVGRSARLNYDLPLWVAIVVAVVIEGVGVGAFYTAEKATAFNLKQAGKLEMPTRGIQAVLVAYIALVMVISLLTDAVPSLSSYAIVFYVCLSGVAYKANAVRLQQAMLEAQSKANVKPADQLGSEPSSKLPKAKLVSCKHGCGFTGSKHQVNGHYRGCKGQPALNGHYA